MNAGSVCGRNCIFVSHVCKYHFIQAQTSFRCSLFLLITNHQPIYGYSFWLSGRWVNAYLFSYRSKEKLWFSCSIWLSVVKSIVESLLARKQRWGYAEHHLNSVLAVAIVSLICCWSIVLFIRYCSKYVFFCTAASSIKRSTRSVYPGYIVSVIQGKEIEKNKDSGSTSLVIIFSICQIVYHLEISKLLA